MPAFKTLSIWRGNSKTFEFRLKQGDGNPVNLTATTVVFTITNGSVKTVKSSAAEGVIIADPLTGIVQCKLTPAETRGICDSRIDGVRYELEVQTADEQTTVLAGKIEIGGGSNSD